MKNRNQIDQFTHGGDGGSFGGYLLYSMMESLLQLFVGPGRSEGSVDTKTMPLEINRPDPAQRDRELELATQELADLRAKLDQGTDLDDAEQELAALKARLDQKIELDDFHAAKTGLDNGRNVDRFMTTAERDDRIDRRSGETGSRTRSEQLSRLQAMLAGNPAYAKLHADAVTIGARHRKSGGRCFGRYRCRVEGRSSSAAEPVATSTAHRRQARVSS